MTITATQTAAILEILSSIMTATAPRGKRQLAGMFLELVDRTDWPQYYEVCPQILLGLIYSSHISSCLGYS